MTKKLYLDDPFTCDFSAALVRTGEAKGVPYAVLDATRFYPEAGGQRADRGTLDGAAVVDVQEHGEEVLHLLDRPLGAAPGTTLAGRVDRAVREDHMQQHTGQHMLSAAFIEVIGAPTISFHMGEDVCTIDLDRDDLTWDQVTQVEDRVNAVIREDRAIRVLYPTPEERAALALRKEPTVTENLRVIQVEGFDQSPCCGTHCTRTGQIGAIHVRRWERVRQKARVHFLCGQRALADHRAKSRLLLKLTAAFSSNEDQLEARVLDAQLRIKDLSKEIEALRERAWTHQATELANAARPVGKVKLVTAPAESPAHAKTLALALTAAPDVVAYLYTPAGDAALAAGTATGVNAGALFKTLVAARGGKGGGQAGLAQGRLAPDAAAALAGEIESSIQAQP